MAFLNSNTTEGIVNMVLDANSRISLSNNDDGGTSGSNSTSGNTVLGYNAGISIDAGSIDITFIGHGVAAS